MSKTAIAIRHVHFEDLGAFDRVLRRHGYAVGYCDAGIDDIGNVDPLAPDLLIVLGGPIGAHEESLYPFLGPELALLEHRLAAARPTLGICLGAQLIARALGARVYRARVKEIGWSELQLSHAGRSGPLACARIENTSNSCPGSGQNRSCARSGKSAPGLVFLNVICKKDSPNVGGAPASTSPNK